MLGFPILYCKVMRPMMFQLSGFCYKSSAVRQGSHLHFGGCSSGTRAGMA